MVVSIDKNVLPILCSHCNSAYITEIYDSENGVLYRCESCNLVIECIHCGAEDSLHYYKACDKVPAHFRCDACGHGWTKDSSKEILCPECHNEMVKDNEGYICYNCQDVFDDEFLQEPICPFCELKLIVVGEMIFCAKCAKYYTMCPECKKLTDKDFCPTCRKKLTYKKNPAPNACPQCYSLNNEKTKYVRYCDKCDQCFNVDISDYINQSASKVAEAKRILNRWNQFVASPEVNRFKRFEENVDILLSNVNSIDEITDKLIEALLNEEDPGQIIDCLQSQVQHQRSLLCNIIGKKEDAEIIDVEEYEDDELRYRAYWKNKNPGQESYISEVELFEYLDANLEIGCKILKFNKS